MSQVGYPTNQTNSWMRWVQLLAGPVLWSLHFLASYFLVEAFCNMGWNFTILGINGLSSLLVTITILAIVSSSLFALKSYRVWRKMNMDHGLRDEFRETARWSEGPREFMYFSGFLLSVLFTAAILMVGIPAFLLRPCA
jgi:hypothetical protein